MISARTSSSETTNDLNARSQMGPIQMRAAQLEPNILQVNIDLPSLGLNHSPTLSLPQLQYNTGQLPHFMMPPPQLDTMSEEAAAPETLITMPPTFDSNSINTPAGIISPYTYRRPSSTAAMTVEVVQGYDDIPLGQSQVHINRLLEANQRDSITHPYHISEGVEVVDFNGDSVQIQPSEISFEDSLLPPEYQSAWGGGPSR
ncbi:hypothetical protein BJ165DRAFT_1441034 [Panaeolus papilionaceus]|nr:hypothetical protein BJ165DRAFT_1441034 [Panaeolus papilionaceus]